MHDRLSRSRPRNGRYALLALIVLGGLLLGFGSRPASANPVGSIDKEELDPRSAAREMIDELVANNFRIVRPAVGTIGTVNTSGTNAQGNRQVNDPSLDKIQTFPGAPPFELATESETSIVSLGANDLVVGYNSSAGTNFVDAAGNISQILFSGFSVSHDGGTTWRSGFVPPLPGSVFTFGDPSLATDRAANVYYASLTLTTKFHFGLQINKSTDHGDTWSPGRLVVQDDGADKEWLAIGPDPAVPSRDNLYVTWTSFTGRGSELWLAKSIDGGTTWTTKRLFAPRGTSLMSPFIQFSNPTVDVSTGRLYIPFLHFSNFDADFVKVLVSDDGGASFRFLTFNVPGAPETTGFPNVTPGALEDCGEFGGPRLALHAGPSTIGGLFGLPRWVQTTRVITQPAAAAANGRLLIALNSSTNPVFGAGTGSEIRVLYSPDGGASWAPPVAVAPSTSSDVQHIHPALTVDAAGGIHVIYYVQDSSEKLRVDGVSGRAVGDHLSFGAPAHVSTGSWDLTPSNITVSPTLTLNFDSVVVPCYDIGEYPSVVSTASGAVAAWGDSRKLWKEPNGALISGTHSQADVFFDRAP